MATTTKGNTEQLLIRVSPETYSGLQLAQPFVERRSMQDLVGAIIDDFLTGLRTRDPGFAQALVGLRESQARGAGVLSRRTTSKGSNAS